MSVSNAQGGNASRGALREVLDWVFIFLIFGVSLAVILMSPGLTRGKPQFGLKKESYESPEKLARGLAYAADNNDIERLRRGIVVRPSRPRPAAPMEGDDYSNRADPFGPVEVAGFYLKGCESLAGVTEEGNRAVAVLKRAPTEEGLPEWVLKDWGVFGEWDKYVVVWCSLGRDGLWKASAVEGMFALEYEALRDIHIDKKPRAVPAADLMRCWDARNRSMSLYAPEVWLEEKDRDAMKKNIGDEFAVLVAPMTNTGDMSITMEEIEGCYEIITTTGMYYRLEGMMLLDDVLSAAKPVDAATILAKPAVLPGKSTVNVAFFFGNGLDPRTIRWVMLAENRRRAEGLFETRLTAEEVRTRKERFLQAQQRPPDKPK
jgi:hypothetical protein